MGLLSAKDKEAIKRGAWCNDTSIPQCISPDAMRLKNTWGRFPGMLKSAADTPVLTAQNGFVETNKR